MWWVQTDQEVLESNSIQFKSLQQPASSEDISGWWFEYLRALSQDLANLLLSIGWCPHIVCTSIYQLIPCKNLGHLHILYVEGQCKSARIRLSDLKGSKSSPKSKKRVASDLVSPQVSGGKWWGGSLLTYLRHGGGSARPRSSSSTRRAAAAGFESLKWIFGPCGMEVESMWRTKFSSKAVELYFCKSLWLSINCPMQQKPISILYRW